MRQPAGSPRFLSLTAIGHSARPFAREQYIEKFRTLADGVVEKAEQDLLKKRAAAEKASRDLASAEQGVERAMAESAKASKALEDRQKALENATIESADATKKFGDAADGADGSSGRFELSLGKVAAAASCRTGFQW